jgi:predicted methyltransferase
MHRIEYAFVIADLEKRGFKLASKSDLLMNADDDHTKSVFDKTIRRKTDRFVLLFEKK